MRIFYCTMQGSFFHLDIASDELHQWPMALWSQPRLPSPSSLYYRLTPLLMAHLQLKLRQEDEQWAVGQSAYLAAMDLYTERCDRVTARIANNTVTEDVTLAAAMLKAELPRLRLEEKRLQAMATAMAPRVAFYQQLNDLLAPYASVTTKPLQPLPTPPQCSRSSPWRAAHPFVCPDCAKAHAWGCTAALAAMEAQIRESMGNDPRRLAPVVHELVGLGGSYTVASPARAHWYALKDRLMSRKPSSISA